MWTRLSGRKGVPTHTVKINFSLQAHCNSKELQSVHVHLYIHVHVHLYQGSPAGQVSCGQCQAVEHSSLSQTCVACVVQCRVPTDLTPAPPQHLTSVVHALTAPLSSPPPHLPPSFPLCILVCLPFCSSHPLPLSLPPQPTSSLPLSPTHLLPPSLPVQVLWHVDVFCRSFREFKSHSCIGNPVSSVPSRYSTCAVHSHIVRSTGHAVECGPSAAQWSVVHWPHGGVWSTGCTVECGPPAAWWSVVYWPYGAFCKAVMGLLLKVHCTCTLYTCMYMYMSTCKCPCTRAVQCMYRCFSSTDISYT